MADFSVTPVNEDIPPNRDAKPIARCEVCGKEWEYNGKGTIPTRCTEHKTISTGRKSPGDNVLREAICDIYRAIAMGVSAFDQFDGMAIAGNAEQLADAWIELAKTNPKVKKWLQKMTQTSGFGGLILAHAMVALPIVEHHGIMPKFGKREPKREM